MCLCRTGLSSVGNSVVMNLVHSYLFKKIPCQTSCDAEPPSDSDGCRYRYRRYIRYGNEVRAPYHTYITVTVMYTTYAKSIHTYLPQHFCPMVPSRVHHALCEALNKPNTKSISHYSQREVISKNPNQGAKSY